MVVAELVLDFPSVASHDATDLIPGIRHNAASFETTKRILFVIIRRYFKLEDAIKASCSS